MKTVKQKNKWRNSHLTVHVLTDTIQYFSTHISDKKPCLKDNTLNNILPKGVYET